VVETSFMRVGDIAKRAGVSPRTVRYYEELGLLTSSGRSRGGFRLYTQKDLDRLRAIEGLKLLGVPLASIQEIFRLRCESPTGADSAPALTGWLTAQMARLDILLDTYQAMKKDMQRTLTILESCAVCDKKPCPETCFVCPYVCEADEVPRLFAAMM
jgi:MerR family Zn(II)-responsive transcriptional regulator of zntA